MNKFKSCIPAELQISSHFSATNMDLRVGTKHC